MDGINDISGRIRLMRSVIGRKIMEMDLFNDRAEELKGDDAIAYVNTIDFLKNDIAGYKSIIDDLRGRKCDYSGNLYDLASVPAETASLYSDFYLPSLYEEDKADEEAAMKLKGEYAVEFSRRYSVQMGRAALVNQMAIDILMADERFAALIGNIVLENPELQNIIENDGEPAGFSARAAEPPSQGPAQAESREEPTEESTIDVTAPMMDAEAALTSSDENADIGGILMDAPVEPVEDAPTSMYSEPSR